MLTMTPSNVIIVVGSLILHKETIRDLLDVKVYVETDEDVRLSRRVMTHINEFGPDNTLKDFLDAYFRFVKPAHEEFIEPSKKYADIIIPNYGFSPESQLGRTFLSSYLIGLEIKMTAIRLIVDKIDAHLRNALLSHSRRDL